MYPHEIAERRGHHFIYATINDSSPLNGQLRDPRGLERRNIVERRNQVRSNDPTWARVENVWVRVEAQARPQPPPEESRGELGSEWGAQFG